MPWFESREGQGGYAMRWLWQLAVASKISKLTTAEKARRREIELCVIEKQ